MLSGFGSVLVGIGFVAAVLLVNAGYVYRNECPRAGGSTETSWTLQWDSVIPYIGYSRSGCETHSATRIALDAAGVWKIDDTVSARPDDHSAEYSADDIAAVTRNCTSSGRSRSFCDCVSSELTKRLSRDEFNALATAARDGSYSSVDEDTRRRASEATVAIERDCNE
jgi:hypothetical protein